jgi:hypothetical protein
MEFLAGLAAFFVFGSLWFWVAFIALVVLICWLQEEDAAFLAGIGVVAFTLLLHASGLVDLKSWTIVTFLMNLVGFVILGVMWSFAKWWFFILRRRDSLSSIRKSFVSRLDIKLDNISASIEDPMPAEHKETFRNYLNEEGYWKTEHRKYCSEDHQTATLIPAATDHKAKIVGWMVFWPWSALWTLLNDPLRRIFNHIFKVLKETYQKISEKVFGNISNDM